MKGGRVTDRYVPWISSIRTFCWTWSSDARRKNPEGMILYFNFVAELYSTLAVILVSDSFHQPHNGKDIHNLHHDRNIFISPPIDGRRMSTRGSGADMRIDSKLHLHM